MKEQQPVDQRFTAYNIGVAFWDRRIKVLSEVVPPNDYELILNLEELELARLKLEQLLRRKEKGLIK